MSKRFPIEFTQTFRSTKEQNIYVNQHALFGLSFIGYARVIFDLHHALIINKSINGQLGIMYANLKKKNARNKRAFIVYQPFTKMQR